MGTHIVDFLNLSRSGWWDTALTLFMNMWPPNGRTSVNKMTQKRGNIQLYGTSYFYILYISNGSRSIARYGSSGYNRVGAEAVARFAICSLGQKTGGNGLILPGQKEEMGSRIRLSRWKVDTRINLVDPFQGGFGFLMDPCRGTWVWVWVWVDLFQGMWVWMTLRLVGWTFPKVPHLPFLSCDH